MSGHARRVEPRRVRRLANQLFIDGITLTALGIGGRVERERANRDPLLRIRGSLLRRGIFHQAVARSESARVCRGSQ